VFLTTCDRNEQKVLLNADINIIGIEMSGIDPTVTFIPEKVCPLIISWLRKVVESSERLDVLGKRKIQLPYRQ
jgi:hypothetical protein